MARGTVITEALAHHRRGWAVLPLRPRDKRPPPEAKAWGEARLNEGELRSRLREDSNLGLITGTLSGGLVDVDLDCQEAVEGADRFLPLTKMTHGHGGQRTHMWYLASPTPKKTQRWKCPTTRDTLLELRSNRSYTMIPPSTHPNGDPVEWIASGPPERCGLPALQRACAQLAAYSWLVRNHWPESQAMAWVRNPRPDQNVHSGVMEWVQPGRRTPGPASRNEISERTKAIYDRASVGVTLQFLGFEVPGRRLDCPIREHRKARNCFSWEGDGGSWFCHGCDKGGNVITLVEAVRGLSYLDARGWIEAKLGLDTQRQQQRPPSAPPIRQEPTAAPPPREQKPPPDRSPQPPAEPAKLVWDTPVPLTGGPLPDFPVEALPDWLAEWVRQEAEETQTPTDMAAFLALGVLAGALQRKFEIRARSRWAEPLNLYTLIVSPPGTRKSAVFAHATAPVTEWETEVCKLARDGAQFLVERAKRHEKRADRLRSQAQAEEDEDKAMELLAAVVETQAKAREAQEAVPPFPRLQFNDVTMERLVGVLARHGGRAGIFSAEGTLFEVAAGRYSSGAANIETLLHAHCGETIRVDRMGRSETVTNPALTVCLAVQPDVLESLAKNRSFRGRGLVARFLFSVPVSNVGQREINPPDMDPAVGASYRDHVRAVLDLEQPDEPRQLTFDPAAQAVFDRYAKTVEGYLARGGRMATNAEWGSKLLGAARLAAILHVADHAGEGDWRADLPPGPVARAVQIAEYMIPHSEQAHQLIGLHASQTDAGLVMEWIKASDPEVFTRRQLQRAVRRFHSADQVQGALDLLEDLGWIRQLTGQDPSARGRGRPANTSYLAHPELVSHE